MSKRKPFLFNQNLITNGTCTIQWWRGGEGGEGVEGRREGGEEGGGQGREREKEEEEETYHEAMESTVVWVNEQGGQCTGLCCAVPAIRAVH